MQKLAAVIALAVFAYGAASASDKTDAMAVVHKWADAFNKGDGKTGATYCADGALIIDDFAPHRLRLRVPRDTNDTCVYQGG
jgi:hypothetical protein